MKRTYEIRINLDGEPNDRTPSGKAFIAGYDVVKYAVDENDCLVDQQLVTNETQVTGLTHDGILGQVLDAALDAMCEDVEKGDDDAVA